MKDAGCTDPICFTGAENLPKKTSHHFMICLKRGRSRRIRREELAETVPIVAVTVKRQRRSCQVSVLSHICRQLDQHWICLSERARQH